MNPIMADRSKFIIRNVRVLEADSFSDCKSVLVHNGVISAIGEDREDLDGVNGQGHYLVPGLIDAHVHIANVDHLHRLAKAGVTTALDMGAWPTNTAKLRALVALDEHGKGGLCDFRSAGIVMTAPNTPHSRFPGVPSDSIVQTPQEAQECVRLRVAEGSDYIKLIADVPGPTQECLTAATQEARRLGKMVIIHAVTYKPFRMAIIARPHIITHAPVDKPLTEDDAREMAKHNIACVPTLVMMRHVKRSTAKYENAAASVLTMHRAGVLVLAGSDAVDYPGVPAQIEHGGGMLEELELLVEAGMSPAEVLAGSTTKTAKYFGLRDRATINKGMRADLVLLKEDPFEDVTAFKRLERVWCAGRHMHLEQL
ncbi:hypothetical protein ANO11243_094480 [Dothideomycetidae sp. 11243]|nr:hypothetical protein ANO11243_094480 [fungal sp. No.11243]